MSVRSLSHENSFTPALIISTIIDKRKLNIMFTATLDIHANPLASKQDQHSTIISGLKPPLDPTEDAPKQGVANLMLLHLF
jgi:hypothetical protein